jgi:TonB family protein
MAATRSAVAGTVGVLAVENGSRTEKSILPVWRSTARNGPSNRNLFGSQAAPTSRDAGGMLRGARCYRSRMVPLFRYCSLVVLGASALIHSAAQISAGDPIKMPTDARDLMLVAAQWSDLTSSAKPWHMKATFKVFDYDGNISDEGTYEEFFAGPNKFKRIFTGKGYTQTDVGTPAGVMRSGKREDLLLQLTYMRREFEAPLPNAKSLGNGPFTEKQVDVAGARLRCITWQKPEGRPEYCIASDEPMLRISFLPSIGTEYLNNRILRFDGHYVPGDLTAVHAGKSILSAHVESIENLDPVNDTDFAAAPDAEPLPQLAAISPHVAAKMLEYEVSPEYPVAARALGVEGKVVLQALIGLDGHVKQLMVVSGPSLLHQSALDAVRTWRYRPFLLNGSRVEALTSISVVFTLGRH